MGSKDKSSTSFPPVSIALGQPERAALASYLTLTEPEGAAAFDTAVVLQPPAPSKVLNFKNVLVASAASNASVLKAELARLSLLPGHARMVEARKALPMYDHRAELLQAVNSHAVALVQGSTGCGKSTQVPQLLIEDAVAHGRLCRIAVAQPRRLAATALADRVATELADDAGVGGLCGYRIRGESKVGPMTAITFMTTGLLLRQLEGEPGLPSLTH
ncbi:unnamed protein product, partial [Polarella glacialis]